MKSNTTFSGFGNIALFGWFFPKPVTFMFNYNSGNSEEAARVARRIARRFSYIDTAEVVFRDKKVDEYEIY